MTNVNKHGVDYSEIEIGDLVKLNMRGEGTVLGYVTYVDSHMIKAIWSDDFIEWREGFSRGTICGYWKVVVHEPKEENLSAAQELSVQQESANFAHAAVQGIINAHAIKLEEDIFKEMDMSEKFTFSDFDLSVSRTWKKQDFKDAVSNAALGLTGEAGEVADLVKKGVYHGRGFTPENAIPDSGEIAPDDVKDELSDVLFYVSAMAQEFGFTLEDVAKHNREKLEKRFPEGFSTEASAQKVDKAPEVKPDGEIRIGYTKHYKEDTLEYVGVDKAPFSVTYFSTDYELKKTLKELREGSRVIIEDKHKGEFQFTKVGNLMRVHFKDLEGELDSHTCLVKVSYEEVIN
ncbi:nucleoside triphosphate pyrophosphohydrolase family protein [Bacillus cereus]|uniref:nucleoside triphosphate pyrophosphohydrolase family protein n=1 Tax=Bacillus cereus TaxID=1396 RepID=UPI003CF9F4C3